MAEVTFYGASDDLVEFEGAVYDEDYVDGDDRWEGALVAPNGDRILLSAHFAKPGAQEDWTLEVLENDENWPVRVGERPDRGEDPALFIEVPEGTVLKASAQ